MHIILLQAGLFGFLIGLVEAVCLVPAMVFSVPAFRKVFSNPVKLKSSHLDFFMQAFALVLVYMLEYATKIPVPTFAMIPLVYGSLCNPLLFLYEATPLISHRIGSKVFPLFMLSSCGSVLFAWGVIGYEMLPTWMKWLWLGFIMILAAVMIQYARKKTVSASAPTDVPAVQKGESA